MRRLERIVSTLIQMTLTLLSPQLSCHCMMRVKICNISWPVCGDDVELVGGGVKYLITLTTLLCSANTHSSLSSLSPGTTTQQHHSNNTTTPTSRQTDPLSDTFWQIFIFNTFKCKTFFLLLHEYLFDRLGSLRKYFTWSRALVVDKRNFKWTEKLFWRQLNTSTKCSQKIRALFFSSDSPCILEYSEF